MNPIAIIGAGAAGIAAARHLAERRQEYVLLEAKPFIGGRCITDRTTLGMPIDLGAHWLHSPAANPLVGYADQFGSDVKQAAMPHYVIADWDNDPHIRGCYSAARVGRADTRSELAAPADDRLFFAREACSRQYMGDVHGAWSTGIAAAEEAAISD